MSGPRFMTRAQALWQFVLTMTAFGVLAWLLQGAQDRQDDAIDQIAVNTTAICTSRNVTITKVNALIDELETSVKQGSTLPPNEQADRVKRYESLKVPLITCPPTPSPSK